jgi:hypothetical protein
MNPRVGDIVVAKYPIKVGDTLIPKGEEGRLATLEEVRDTFPRIGYVEGASYYGVVFRNLKPILVDRSQINFQQA